MYQWVPCDLDFSVFRNYLRKEIIRVLEIHPMATQTEIKKGMAYLRDLVRGQDNQLA